MLGTVPINSNEETNVINKIVEADQAFLQRQGKIERTLWAILDGQQPGNQEQAFYQVCLRIGNGAPFKEPEPGMRLLNLLNTLGDQVTEQMFQDYMETTTISMVEIFRAGLFGPSLCSPMEESLALDAPPEACEAGFGSDRPPSFVEAPVAETKKPARKKRTKPADAVAPPAEEEALKAA